MARLKDLTRAKEAFLEVAGGKSWLRSVGIAEVDGQQGLVIGIAPRAKAIARRLCEQLDLGVPVRFRGQSEGAIEEPLRSNAGTDTFEQLRRKARALLDKDS